MSQAYNVIRSRETSHIEGDATWAFLSPQILANWDISHHCVHTTNLGFFFLSMMM